MDRTPAYGLKGLLRAIRIHNLSLGRPDVRWSFPQQQTRAIIMVLPKPNKVVLLKTILVVVHENTWTKDARLECFICQFDTCVERIKE